MDINQGSKKKQSTKVYLKNTQSTRTFFTNQIDSMLEHVLKWIQNKLSALMITNLATGQEA